jgi:hypothetical protein
MRVLDVAASNHDALNGRRRARLGRVIDLARIYRDCDLKSLARDLGRDPTRVVPHTGNPKVDLLVGLARNLEWPLTEVVRAIRGEHEPEEARHGESSGSDLQELDVRCIRAHRAGHHREMLRTARDMRQRARNGAERRLALIRLYGALDAMGHFRRALECAHQGVAEAGDDPAVRGILLANLANAHYTLWNLVEARTVASEVIAMTTPGDRRTRATLAFAHYVRGHARRRSLVHASGMGQALVVHARSDLSTARNRYRELVADTGDQSHLAIGDTCDGGVIELDAAAGIHSPEDAIRMLRTQEGDDAVGDMLESRGWRAIFGSNIVRRHLDGRQQAEELARFVRELGDIAEQLGNWAFRAEAASIELDRRDRARGHGIELEPWVLDQQSMRTLIHTMGRLPAFRETGWRILDEHGALDRAVKSIRKGLKRGKERHEGGHEEIFGGFRKGVRFP